MIPHSPPVQEDKKAKVIVQKRNPSEKENFNGQSSVDVTTTTHNTFSNEPIYYKGGNNMRTSFEEKLFGNNQP